jgi:hypothetical protein
VKRLWDKQKRLLLHALYHDIQEQGETIDIGLPTPTDLERRYMRDAVFHNMVASLVNAMEDGVITRGYILEALDLAEQLLARRQALNLHDTLVRRGWGR